MRSFVMVENSIIRIFIARKIAGHSWQTEISSEYFTLIYNFVTPRSPSESTNFLTKLIYSFIIDGSENSLLKNPVKSTLIYCVEIYPSNHNHLRSSTSPMPIPINRNKSNEETISSAKRNYFQLYVFPAFVSVN